VEPRVSLVTLGVGDLQRAVGFCRDGLGWPRSEVGGDEEVAWNPSFPMAEDGSIELPD
jgi:hypothetical protein